MRGKVGSVAVGAHSVAAIVIAGLLLFASSGSSQSGSPAVTIISPSKQAPVQTNLVSDIPGLAVTGTTDPNLINPWGIAYSASSPYWVSDQGTSKSTLYNGLGAITPLLVAIPTVGSPSGPTGIVAVPAGATGFVVPGTTNTAHFIFATLDGTIAGWASGGSAVTTVTMTGASFTGLAFANNGSANYLYAANFVSGGTIDVFNSSFQSTTLAGTFTDPTLPAGYAPFNIAALGGNLYVLFANYGAPGLPAGGAGAGYVSIFDANGNFKQRLISNGSLNGPWGIALAPSGFTSFPGALLVGNFVDGEINAFNATTGAPLGTITDPDGKPIANQGLWTIEFGNGNPGSNPNALYFTAGINGEQDGLFGSINPGPPTLTFGTLLVSTTSTAAITVENTGTAALSITVAPALSSTTEFAIATTGTTCTNGASIAPGASCAIAITFTPSAAGARGPVTLTITDNAPSGTQTVIVTGTGTSGAPAATLSSATPLTFTAQLVSTTSAAQTITITNSGSAPLTFPSTAISVTDDFAQTNTCSGATVAVNATCTISVTFTPAATTNNPRTGTITITDNASNSPQTVALSGTGEDFSLSLPSGSLSVNPGTPGTMTVTVGALGGFNAAVTLSCSGTVFDGSCAVSPASVTAPSTATITFMTAAPSNGAQALLPPGTRRIPPVPSHSLAFLVAALALLLVLPFTRRRRIRWSLAGAMFLLLLGSAGCTSHTPANPGTPAGSYSFAVTGTSGGVTHTTNVTLTVN